MARRFTNINYYSLLGVMSDASRDEIRTAYRAKVRIVHPDHGGDPEVFAQVAEAWEVLSNESERAIYDADHKLRMRTNRHQATRLPRDEARSGTTGADREERDLADRFGAPAKDVEDRFNARKQWMANKRRIDRE